VTEEFTARERAILRGLASGLQLIEVRERLARHEYITPDHLKKNATVLYRKLGVRTQAGAVVEAIRRGLISCPCPEHTTPHPTPAGGTRHA
jgi:DNA-binding NarL/FixJ family response regulator